MSSGVDEASASTSSGRNPATSSVFTPQQQHPDAAASSTADQTSSSIQFRNGITSPGSPGSDGDSTINSAAFAPSILASRLGRSIYSSAGAAGSSLSLAGSGFNSPALALTGFNAISTVLNNPAKRQHPIDPKSSRFPPVTPNHVPAEIPKVKKAELDPYLSSVRPEWDRFMRNQGMGRQGKATIEQQQQQQLQLQHSSAYDSSQDSEPLVKQNSRHRSTASMASLSADLQAVPPPPQPRKRLPNLSAVPQVFFSEDFDLGNPYTFDQVTERYKVAATSPSEQNGSMAPTYDIALNQMLQEKLSYYSDVIEQHLIIEIGQQSSSFFAALENLNDLNAEAESCLRKINHLKSELDSIDQNQAKKGLQVIQQQHQRRQLERKQTVVEDVRQVVERRDLVRLLLQQGETEEALDLLNKLRSALRRSDSKQDQTQNGVLAKPSVVNGAATADAQIVLSDLQCLADIPSQLDEMEHTLSGMLEQDLIAILRQDIDARLEAYRKDGASSTADDSSYFSKVADQPPGQQTMLTPSVVAGESTLTPSKPPPSPFGHSSRALSPSDSEMASRIAPLVIGLAKTGGIEKAIMAYREVAIQAVRETWRTTLSQSSAEMAETVNWLLTEDLANFDDHDSLPPPAARIRDLDHASFLNTARELFDTLMESLKTIDAHCRLVPRILHASAANGTSAENTAGERSHATDATTPGIVVSTELPLPPVMPPGVPTNLPAKLSEVVAASAEQAHSLSARLLSLRATTHAALELPPFLVVFQLCWGFVLSSEQLCRKMVVGLRGTILGQAKGFLANFHRRRIERAAKAVEEETWAQADVGIQIQAQIRQIVSSAVEDPADFVVSGGDGQLGQDSSEQAKAKADTETDQDAASASTKTLDIEDRQYFVVDASLDVLALLVDYLKVIINLPLLTTEAMARVVEFLKQFNSRTCQVVLGAGAMRSAGLKNITAKHLALASQSLSIIISLIPYIRETVRRHLSPKQAVMLTEFDKLRRDFQEHQYEIHAKLVAIMSDRLTVHCRTLSAIDWNAAAVDSQGGDDGKDAEPNKYAADLVKETATLHKVLSKYLQPVVVEHVIGQVLRAIDSRLAQEFEKVPVQNQQALDRMQTDVRYLGTKLSVLKHVEWKDEAMQQMLATKRLAQPPTVNVTASAGSSTPNSEVAPGSPALDKPANSPFGPVTYKPRIPNIFARRQQQQQQSQLGSPRASTDVTGTSTPIESTPRTSLQMQRQQSQLATATTAAAQDSASSAPTEETQQAALTTVESSTNAQTLGAQSIQEEVDNVPPTPPSKAQERRPSITVKADEADARESEDLIAPVVPAPDAVARVLADGGRASSDLAAAPLTEAEVVPVAENVLETDRDVDSASADQQQQAYANKGAPPTDPTSQDVVEAVQETSTEAPKQDAAPILNVDTSAVDAPVSAEPKETHGPSTPKKDVRPISAAHQPAAHTGAAGESSPARSGASTPATTTPTGTPAKPGRMSLKERLAEAARKRAQQSNPMARLSSQAETQPTGTTAASASAPPSETVAVEAAPTTTEKTAEMAKGDQDALNAKPAEKKPQTPSTESAPVSSEGAAAQSAEDIAEVSADPADGKEEIEKNGLLSEHSVPHEEALGTEVAKDQKKPDHVSSGPATVEAGGTASTTPSEGAGLEDAKQPDAVETTSTSAEETVAKIEQDSHITTPADQRLGEAEGKGEQTPPTANGTQATVTAAEESATAADTRDDQDEEGDGDGDGEDAGADADPNEGTNDSAIGGSGAGTGSKKNKKKKKKGKKK
ncbi:hypothetical protein EX895_001833 [Sporisorium graminicola]|uniref:Vacuolar protein sorting-associated protein 54 n=1 Tax=Sporisorium graminicola TaxID=280036 RepID=A0A4U7L210_9BASI|nr:hypothetical protein EX895_001833 [Sporisorium graminicola]TKY89302.1 hypothetical protein EX895_001833 [Sporisorium graminicola]